MHLLVFLFAFVFTDADAFGFADDSGGFDTGDKFDSVINNNLNKQDDSLFSGSKEPTVMEGDIVVNQKLLSEIAEMEQLTKNGESVFDAIKRGTWPNGIIPYTISPGAESALRATIRSAAQEYSDKTGGCIKWKYYDRTEIRKFSPHYVTFFIGGGCYSMIGRQAQPQQISLGRGCIHKGICIHEMMHALGFFHEQSRTDRDNYITINWSYIPRGLWYNFKKYQPGQADTFGEGYDKNSIMHYGNYAFTTVRGRKTIVSRSNPSEVLGQRKGLSAIDVKQLKKYYKCKDGTTTEPTEAPSTGCKDNQEFCVVLGRYCTNAWVKSNCKKTCNGCVKCEDSSTYAHKCPGWKTSGYCTDSRYKSWLGKHCAKSCGNCS